MRVARPALFLLLGAGIAGPFVACNALIGNNDVELAPGDAGTDGTAARDAQMDGPLPDASAKDTGAPDTSTGDASDAATGDATVEAGSPALTLTPSPQDFGMVVDGNASGDILFTATNVGGATTAALGVSFGGTAAAEFALDGANACAGATLAPNATCKFNVRFIPSAGATGTQVASVTATAGSLMASATLIGEAVAPNPSLTLAPQSPSTGNFGSVAFGVASAAQTFVLTNTGNVATGVPGTPMFTGANEGDFTIPVNGNQCTASLAPNATCTIQVVFTPETTTSEIATLGVSTPFAGMTTTSLSGVGTGCNVATDCSSGEACNTTTHACSNACNGGTTLCNGGCCNGGLCAAGNQNSICGTSGGACLTCTGSAPTCAAGGCTATCGSAGDGTCGGGTCCGGTSCITSSGCTAGTIQCASSTAVETCVGVASCAAWDAATCPTDAGVNPYVCERYGGASCVDPAWAEWPMPNGGADSPPAPNLESYSNNGDGTITDNVTGLMWQQTPTGDGGTFPTMTWSGGQAYCVSLSLGGHNDWRLPSVIELQSIVDPSVYLPAINATYFPGVPTNTGLLFYASNLVVGSSIIAWTVGFDDGSTRPNYTSNDNYVRCVR